MNTNTRRDFASGWLATAATLLSCWTAAPNSNAQAVKPAPPATEEVVTISPFEVVADTKGYFSTNTMSGTRFNTKLEDLASSLTVVTKEQMNDFAMLDLDDVFLYTANTEGTGTYTDAFVGYRTRLFSGKVGTTFRLNVRNLQEGGRLQPIGAFPDGTPHSYRIVDPRQFILQATFDL